MPTEIQPPDLPTDDPSVHGRSLEVLWRAVEERDARFDGLLLYGVLTTGIYCRPTCPSRRPKRRNVRFYATRAGAEADGLRPCRRCRPDSRGRLGPEAELVLATCRAIEGHEDLSPTLPELSRSVGVSERRLREVFRRVLGTSPASYARALRVGRLRTALRAGASVTDAVYEAGFGSPSRVYESTHQHLGMTPATYAKAGEGVEVHWVVRPTDLGWLLVAGTEKGVCAVRLGDSREDLISGLAEELHRAELEESEAWVGPWADALMAWLSRSRPWPALPVDVRATAFQARVWTALRRIPEGATATYSQIARELGVPGGARAVGRACATNPVALAVPCHRVLAGDGALRGFRWGTERKARLLELESATAGESA
ncbi:MAG: methylated-DNA--[protein]-cysteine S-methyltransferase [Holophagales bacterium]|nr:methylated-DNA--[protein]-cysteine S-methyltransferase [Holophagales bacterium]